MNIISLLSSDNYIVINRDMLKEYGINVTLMIGELASEYNYYDKNGKLDDGMFFSTIENISEKTGLSKYQQAEALKTLDEMGIVKTIVKGIPAKRFFKLDVEKLEKQIANSSTSSCQKTGKLDGEKLETKNNNKTVINNSNKKKVSKKVSYDEQITAYTENEELQNTLKAFIQMRSMIKKPLTDYAMRLMLNNLNKLANDDNTKIAILNQSIMHNWQGVFPLKNGYTEPQKQQEEPKQQESKDDNFFDENGNFDPDKYNAYYGYHD